ncbi:MAG TPA: Gmad2 immunoglobulin-like domain-containing protein [Anaerolineales bacterium]|nr:Gmad2 immunoglobulin-like domain-containing protein [Anaerolineales bacterium]
MVSRYSLILLLGFFLIGCRPATPPPTPAPVVDAASPAESVFNTPDIPTQTPPLTDISAEQVRNARYELGAADIPRTVALVEGIYQEGAAGSADFLEVRATDFIASGDLDGDGVHEAVTLISETYGGSGVFVFLAVYFEQQDAAVFRASVFVDDRPQINAISIEQNEIFLDATLHRMDEPECCPTLRTTRHYRFINDQLDMSEFTTFTPDGRPRSITIESPENGAEVFSSVQIKGTVAVAPFENNLAYSIEDAGGVELARGAISVSAPEAGAPGAFETVISLGSILSGAVIRLEVQDISAEDGSLFAMDSVELVVK